MSETAQGRDPAPIDDSRLAHYTRQLQEAVVALGLDARIREVVAEIPDASERLQYVGRMTEAAAHKVLNLVDEGQTACEAARSAAAAAATSLEAACARLEAAGGDPDALAALREALRQQRASEAFARSVTDTLTQVMLAQDFQDLSGQVIKKVIGIIGQTEAQLQAMVEHTVGGAPPQRAPVDLDGPQVPDKALKQDDVDALLASLDF